MLNRDVMFVVAVDIVFAVCVYVCYSSVVDDVDVGVPGYDYFSHERFFYVE